MSEAIRAHVSTHGRLVTLILLAALTFAAVLLLGRTASAGVALNVTVNDPADTNTVANRTACFTGTAGCTFRAAISVTNSNGQADTINVLADTYNLTIDNAANDEDGNATGDLDIIDAAGGLTINGAGAATTILESSQVDDRFFDVVSSVIAVEINDVTIRNGVASGDITSPPRFCDTSTTETDACGGAIYSNGDVTIDDSVFTGNDAPDCCGGAIAIFDNDLVVRKSSFSGNRSSSLCCGGALFADAGSMTIEDSVFTPNTVEDCCGGAIYGQGQSEAPGTGTDITIRRSQVNGNSSGGCCGGGIWSSEGSLTIEDSQVNGNTVLSDCCGGGIYIDEGPLTISGSQVNDNVMAGDGGLGGGIHMFDFPELSFVDSQVNGNSIPNSCCGAGLYYEPFPFSQGLGLSQPQSPRAEGPAGPPIQESDLQPPAPFGAVLGDALIENSEFVGNFTFNDPTLSDLGCCGGGIYLEEGVMTIVGSLIADNNLFNNCCGGAVDNNRGELTIIDSVIRGNIAGSFGAGVLTDLGPLAMTGSAVVANTPGDGIAVEGSLAEAEISTSDICLNSEAGLRLGDGAIVADAINNFWGDESGPEHPENPGGTGDLIIDGANGGSGNAIFEPFATEPFTTECFEDEEEPGGGGGAGPGAEEPEATATPAPGAEDDDDEGPVVTTGDGSAGGSGSSLWVVALGIAGVLLTSVPVFARLRRCPGRRRRDPRDTLYRC